MKRERLLVVGNGMAGIRAVEDVLACAPERYAITVFGAEPHSSYSRLMLSPVLAGEKTFADIVTHDRAWYAQHDVTLHSGTAVSAIHTEARILVTADGRSFAYDKLILATGSNPFILPVEGRDLPGVVTFRDADDVEAMLGVAKRGKHAVVIGGGLLGLEAACGLRQRGMDVTVVHLMPDLMERQLDREASGMLRRAIENRGIAAVCGAETEALLGDKRVRAVTLKDGREIPADLVVMAVGIRPNADLARTSGLAVGRGIIVDDQMRSSDPHIFAVGECVEHDGICHGLVAPLYDMAAVLGRILAGEKAAYHPVATATRLKVSGVDVFSAGHFAVSADCEDIVLRDPDRSFYRRLVLRDDRIVGAVLYGDTADGGFFFDLIQRGTDISALRDILIFGPALCEAA
jgi:nitrite reductase (NADH) large subunit